jgi:hemoglobin
MGGMPYFERLVGAFYASVAVDPVLRPLYPDADLGPAARRLALFLAQYWGGPASYSAERGHPRLRSRHFRFAIGTAERDRWLAHMRAAVESAGTVEEWRDELLRYFESAAEAMRNLEP